MEWADVWQVALQSILSLIVLFLLTKLMGNRQMSQLTMFDYITGISIGSIAAEMASHPEPDSWLGVEAMAIYAALTVGINVLNTRSLKARNLLLGSPLVLYDNGALYFQNLKKARLDLNEILAECRGAGYFDLSQLQMIVLEVNGKLSFLPNEQFRPLTPQDMQLTPAQERPVVAVIMDGVLFPSRLRAIGLTVEWLQKQLTAQGQPDISQVLLATVDNQNTLLAFPKDLSMHSKEYYA